MRKPVSKHALRRAMESARAEGLIQWSDPTGTVVDQLWHLMEKQAFGVRKRATPRETIREIEVAEV